MTKSTKCKDCNGYGEILASADPINPSSPNVWEQCETCEGIGYIIEETEEDAQAEEDEGDGNE